MPDDFCLEHGYEFMRCDRTWGAIPYCSKCAETGPAEAIETIREDLREILTKPAPEPTYTEVTTKYGHTFKARNRRLTDDREFLMTNQRLAQLEGLAIGLDQRGEKSAAHLIRLSIKDIEELRKALYELLHASFSPVGNDVAALAEKHKEAVARGCDLLGINQNEAQRVVG